MGKMNRSSFALFVAVLIHIVLLLLFWILGTILPAPEQKEIAQKEKRIKVSLKEMPKKQKKSSVKEKPKLTPMAKPMPKGGQLKKIVKKPLIKHTPKPPKKVEYKPKPKPKPIEEIIKPEPITKPLPTKKEQAKLETKKAPVDLNKTIEELSSLKIAPKIEPIQEPIVEPKPKKEKSIYSLLSQDHSKAQEKKKDKQKSRTPGSINQNIKELYGDKFGELTQAQQEYILDNQEIMRRITQQVLNRVASVNLRRSINVNRTNVIEFYLHPNGDISDFKFIKKSGFYILDDTTKETIDYAYSRYPRPKEKTLIRYNVYYNLAH